VHCNDGVGILALILFFSKKGYDYYQAKSGFTNAANNNPAFKANPNAGALA
jgi:hypothetical protein